MPRSSSTKALTYSTMAFEMGQRTTSSHIHSMTAVATMPTTITAIKAPTGPHIARDLLLPLKKPMPMIPPRAMNLLIVNEGRAGGIGHFELQKFATCRVGVCTVGSISCVLLAQTLPTEGSTYFRIPSSERSAMMTRRASESAGWKKIREVTKLEFEQRQARLRLRHVARLPQDTAH